MSIDWSKFQQASPGDYPERWRPENPGDEISGVIAAMRVATMPDGTQYPSITLKTASGERELLASQAMLLRGMAQHQPKIGDTLSIRFTEIEKLSGGRTLKHFSIDVKRSDNTSTDIL